MQAACVRRTGTLARPVNLGSKVMSWAANVTLGSRYLEREIGGSVTDWLRSRGPPERIKRVVVNGPPRQRGLL
jgi:hypothetical protein